MNLRKEYSLIFNEFLKKDPKFEEFYDIVKKRSEGKIWVIGSYVYKNIIKELYGKGSVLESDKVDVDFVVENPLSERGGFKEPEGWDVRFTLYPSIFFEREVNNEKQRIDLNYLKTFINIYERGLKPNISNLLNISPFNIQSIAYDCDNKILIGGSGKKENIGFNAIRNKIVDLNDYTEAKRQGEKKGLSLEEYVKEKADELGFNLPKRFKIK